MMRIPLVVTAQNETTKDLNLMLASIQDYEFPAEPPTTVVAVNQGTEFVLLGPPYLHIMDEHGHEHEQAARGTTQLPVEGFTSPFAGWSLEAVVGWLERSATALSAMRFEHSLPFVVDDEGFESKTVLLLERVLELDGGDEEDKVGEDDDGPAGVILTEDPDSPLLKYRIARVPYDQVHVMWANLSIANMEFYHYVGLERDVILGRLYDWVPFSDPPNEGIRASQDAARQRMEQVLSELRNSGHIA